MKIIAFLAVIAFAGIVLLPLQSYAEPHLRPQNAAYLEVGGAAMLGSLNYQRNFFFSERGHVSARIGMLYGGRGQALIPITLFYSFAVKHGTFELGAGYTASRPKDGYPSVHLIGGFKKQIKNNLFFKILATPVYPLNPKKYDPPFWPWGGISLGWDF